MANNYENIIIEFTFKEGSILPEALQENLSRFVCDTCHGEITVYRIMRDGYEHSLGEIVSLLLPDNELLQRYEALNEDENSSVEEWSAAETELRVCEESALFWLESFRDAGCTEVEVYMQFLCDKPIVNDHGIYWQAARIHEGVIQVASFDDRGDLYRDFEKSKV